MRYRYETFDQNSYKLSTYDFCDKLVKGTVLLYVNNI